MLMETTFALARNLGVSPFDIMAQDTEAVIMVVNHIIECAEEKRGNTRADAPLTEKERDGDFWAVL